MTGLKSRIPRVRADNRDTIANYLLNMMVFFIFLPPEILSHTGVYNYIRIIQNVLCIFSLLILIKYFNNKYLRIITIFFAWFFICTVINNSDYGNVLYHFARTFGLCSMAYLIYRLNRKVFWQSLADYLFLLVILNTVLSIMFPTGIIQVYSINDYEKDIHFLGERNQIIPYYIIAVTVNEIVAEFNHQSKTKSYFLIACMVISGFIYMSSTSLIGITVYLLMWILQNRKKEKNTRLRKRRWKIIIGAIGVILLYYLVVVLRIQNNFEYLFHTLFNKDATFSTRTAIWDAAIKKISLSPIYGYGGTASKYLQLGRRLFNSHNIMLQLLLMGGVVLLLIFVRLVIYSCKDIVRIPAMRARKVLISMLLTLFITSLTEVYPIYLLVFALFLPSLTFKKEKVTGLSTTGNKKLY